MPARLPLAVALVAALAAGSAARDEVGDAIGAIDGRPLPAAPFLEFVLAEQGRAGPGAAALEHLIQERIVARESRARGIAVTSRDLDARIAALDAGIRAKTGGREGLDAQIAATGMTLEAFRDELAKAIACERMMRADFGLRDGDVPAEKQALWFQEAKARAGVRLEGLAPGVAAEIADETIGRGQWARQLFAALPDADAARLFDEWVGIELLAAAAAREGLEVTPQHVAREIQERDAALAARLRESGMNSDGVDYLSMLRARGEDPEAVVAGPRFRAEILLKELARLRHGAGGWRRYYDEHRAEFDRAFGRRVRVATIHLRAGARRGPEVPRTWSEAADELAAIAARVSAGDVPAAEAFASFARLKSEHDSAARGGDLGFLAQAELERLALPVSLLDQAAGTLAGPFTGPEGVHLVRVAEQRAASPFEQIVDEVEKAARRQLLQELRAAAKVERGI